MDVHRLLGTIAAATPLGPAAIPIGAAAGAVAGGLFGDDGVNQTKMVQNQHKSNKRAVKYQNNQIAQQYQYNVTKREIDIQKNVRIMTQ